MPLRRQSAPKHIISGALQKRGYKITEQSFFELLDEMAQV